MLFFSGLGWALLPCLAIASSGGHLQTPRHVFAQLRVRNATASAESIVQMALVAVRERNRARLEHPKFNKEEFAPGPPTPELAPPLQYHDNSTLARRNLSSSEPSSAYTIPPEVVAAAKEVAESTDQTPLGDHESLAAAARDKYQDKSVNDTNSPEPQGTPEGKLAAWAGLGLEPSASNGSELAKRASGYWMIDMEQRGSSPYAPAGYQVWRNVKDFGAIGDGIHDDTAAINNAISSGGRCGPNCGSSTIFPAVVYFPPGTYLVSVPIIQYYNTQFLGDVRDLVCQTPVT
jgi:hypothetical protein